MRARRWWVVVVAVLSVMAGGCWLQAAQGPGMTASNPFESQITASTVHSLHVAWQRTLANTNLTEPLVAQSVVYVGSPGSLTALNLSTGATIWNVLGFGQPTLVGSRLAIPSGGCGPRYVDAVTGANAGSATFGDPVGITWSSKSCSDPVGAAGTVVGTWFEGFTETSSACGGPAQPTPFFARGIEAVGKWNNWVSGPVCSTPPPPAPPLGLAYGALATVGNFIYAADSGTGLAALRTDTGAQVRVTDVGSPVVSVAAAGPSDVAVVTGDGRVVVLDTATGTVQWSAQAAASNHDLSRLATTSTTIFVVTSAGAVDAFPIAGCGLPTCSPAWTATIASPLRGGPSIGGDVLYVGSANGAVTAFPANACGHATCSSLWSTTIAHGAAEGVSISDGHLLVASADGTVTAFIP